MKMRTIRIMGMMAAVAMVAAGCGKKSESEQTGTAGVMERTGAAVDRAAEKTAEAANTAAEKTAEAAKATATATKDAAGVVVEKTGEALEKASSAVEGAGTDMQE